MKGALTVAAAAVDDIRREGPPCEECGLPLSLALYMADGKTTHPACGSVE